MHLQRKYWRLLGHVSRMWRIPTVLRSFRADVVLRSGTYARKAHIQSPRHLLPAAAVALTTTSLAVATAAFTFALAAAALAAAALAAAALAAAALAAAALTATLAAAALAASSLRLHRIHGRQLPAVCGSGRRRVRTEWLHGQPLRQL